VVTIVSNPRIGAVMSNLALVSAFVGIVMPLVVSVINQEHWSSQLKGVVALLVSFVAAAVTTWAEGGLHGHSLASSFLIVFGATIATYRVFWKPTGISDKVETATTVKKTAPATA
jgi:hypothetical protein